MGYLSVLSLCIYIYKKKIWFKQTYGEVFWSWLKNFSIYWIKVFLFKTNVSIFFLISAYIFIPTYYSIWGFWYLYIPFGGLCMCLYFKYYGDDGLILMGLGIWNIWMYKLKHIYDYFS